MSSRNYLVYDQCYNSCYSTYAERDEAVKAARDASLRKNHPVSVFYHDTDVVTKIFDDKIVTFEL